MVNVPYSKRVREVKVGHRNFDFTQRKSVVYRLRIIKIGELMRYGEISFQIK